MGRERRHLVEEEGLLRSSIRDEEGVAGAGDVSAAVDEGWPRERAAVSPVPRLELEPFWIWISTTTSSTGLEREVSKGTVATGTRLSELSFANLFSGGSRPAPVDRLWASAKTMAERPEKESKDRICIIVKGCIGQQEEERKGKETRTSRKIGLGGIYIIPCPSPRSLLSRLGYPPADRHTLRDER